MQTEPITQRLPTPKSIRELELRALALQGASVAELADALQARIPDDPRRSKGFIGLLVEHALGAHPNAGDRPDFLSLNVELKTLPITEHKKPKESTFCCSIAMATADEALWETSRLRQRLAHVLWLPVDASPTPLGQRTFHRARRWQPSQAQWQVLQNDWHDLIGRIGAGAGASITAHQGQALQIRPKAANASVRTWGPGENDEGAQAMLPLGFYLRTSFTTAILQDSQNNIPDHDPCNGLEIS